MIDSKNFGIILYVLMAFFHILIAINAALHNDTWQVVVMLFAAAFWTAMLHFDPQLKD